MNRYDVVQTIRHVGEQFSRVLACVQSEDYVAGYNQAVKDMVQIFEYNQPATEEKPRSKKIVLFGGARGHRNECS